MMLLLFSLAATSNLFCALPADPTDRLATILSNPQLISQEMATQQQVDALMQQTINFAKPFGNTGETIFHLAILAHKYPEAKRALPYLWQKLLNLPQVQQYINLKNALGQTPLYLAVEVEMTNDLLNKGANPNIQSAKGATALHHAADLGKLNEVQTLLNRGADPTIKNQFGNVPYQDAIRNNHWQVAGLLKDWALRNHKPAAAPAGQWG